MPFCSENLAKDMWLIIHGKLVKLFNTVQLLIWFQRPRLSEVLLDYHWKRQYVLHDSFSLIQSLHTYFFEKVQMLRKLHMGIGSWVRGPTIRAPIPSVYSSFQVLVESRVLSITFTVQRYFEAFVKANLLSDMVATSPQWHFVSESLLLCSFQMLMTSRLRLATLRTFQQRYGVKWGLESPILQRLDTCTWHQRCIHMSTSAINNMYIYILILKICKQAFCYY